MSLYLGLSRFPARHTSFGQLRILAAAFWIADGVLILCVRVHAPAHGCAQTHTHTPYACAHGYAQYKRTRALSLPPSAFFLGPLAFRRPGSEVRVSGPSRCACASVDQVITDHTHAHTGTHTRARAHTRHALAIHRALAHGFSPLPPHKHAESSMSPSPEDHKPALHAHSRQCVNVSSGRTPLRL